MTIWARAAGTKPSIRSPTKELDVSSGPLDEQVDARNHEHRRQRDHDRLQPAIGDEIAVHGTDASRRREPEKGPQQLVADGIALLAGHDDIGQGHDRAGRKIEAPNQDDDRLAHRGERQRRRCRGRGTDLEIAERGSPQHGDRGEHEDRADRDRQDGADSMPHPAPATPLRPQERRCVNACGTRHLFPRPAFRASGSPPKADPLPRGR